MWSGHSNITILTSSNGRQLLQSTLGVTSYCADVMNGVHPDQWPPPKHALIQQTDVDGQCIQQVNWDYLFQAHMQAGKEEE